MPIPFPDSNGPLPVPYGRFAVRPTTEYPAPKAIFRERSRPGRRETGRATNGGETWSNAGPATAQERYWCLAETGAYDRATDTAASALYDRSAAAAALAAGHGFEPLRFLYRPAEGGGEGQTGEHERTCGILNQRDILRRFWV